MKPELNPENRVSKSEIETLESESRESETKSDT